MAIPDYQTLMLPVLQCGAAGEANVRDAIARLAGEFKLTDEERTELLPSGKQAIFTNRVQWAKTYLVKAGLLQATKRGHFAISERGRAVLTQNPQRIDNSFLDQFEEFRQFRNAARLPPAPVDREQRAAPPSLEAATPEERVEAASNEIEEDLRAELLERVLKMSPAFFEKVVVDLLLAMGYGGAGTGSGKRIGRTGDGGVDGVINEDALGLDIVYIQAKRYAPGNVVGVDRVREFSGAMEERGAIKGVFVTTSHFAPAARSFAERVPKRLILVDGKELSRLLVRYGVGVRAVRTVELKKVDLDYFEEEEA
jgi:restriction system protein